MTPYVLLLLVLASPPAPMAVETVQTLDLGKMTFAEAQKLDGQTVRVSFAVWLFNAQPRAIRPLGMPIVVKAFAVGTAPAWRHIVFQPGGEAGTRPFQARMTVEGRMWTRRLPPRIVDGILVDEDRRIEVRDARLVIP